MTKDQIRQLIEAGLPDAQVTVLGDDGQHFEATVISPSFAGKTPIAQHRMVYATLGEKMGRDIHALKLSTRAA
ncbi:MAG TPA: BolA/IbaG family iron-sulfur metabolism protein [Solimonas sp.]|nr:BolA/IbaG family iron-sulfur metabolism protein [Solimonas sp.]